MTDLVFFYGTLMTPFHRAGRLRVDQHLVYTGRGTIAGALHRSTGRRSAIPYRAWKCTARPRRMRTANSPTHAWDEGRSTCRGLLPRAREPIA